jgi:ubiquitin
MQNITVRFDKRGGILKPLTAKDAALYYEFKKELAEGEIVELYITKITNEDDKTSGQLAKVHACIRELARETGHTFEEMKEIVKEKAGLYDPASKEYKSFSDCDKKELSDAIQNCIELGNIIGYYF